MSDREGANEVRAGPPHQEVAARIADGVGQKRSKDGVLHYYHASESASSRSSCSSPPVFAIRWADEVCKPLNILDLPREIQLACLPSRKKERRAAQLVLMQTCKALSQPMADAMYSSLELHPRRLFSLLRCFIRAENSPESTVGGRKHMASLLAKVPRIRLDTFDRELWPNTVEGIFKVCEMLYPRVLLPNLDAVLLDIPYDAYAVPDGKEYLETTTASTLMNLCRAKYICFLGPQLPESQRRSTLVSSDLFAKSVARVDPEVVTFHNVVSHSLHIGIPALLNRVVVLPDHSLIGSTSLYWWVHQQSDLFVAWIKSGDQHSRRRAAARMDEKWEFYQSGVPPLDGFDWTTWKTPDKSELLPGNRDQELAWQLETLACQKYQAARGRIKVFTFAETASKVCAGCGKRLSGMYGNQC